MNPLPGSCTSAYDSTMPLAEIKRDSRPSGLSQGPFLGS